MIETTEFEFPSDRELPFVVAPEGYAQGLILYLHWFDEAPNANRTQFVDEAKVMAADGYGSILPQLSFPWKSPPTGLSADTEAIAKESAYLVELVAEARHRFDVDRLAVVGHDFGAMHGSLIATELGSVCNVFIAPTPRWGDWFLRFWPIEDDRYDYLRGMEPFDPIAAVRGIEAPTLYQFARFDFYIAPMTGLELFGAANEPKTMLAYDTDHAVADDAAVTARRDFLREHLAS